MGVVGIGVGARKAMNLSAAASATCSQAQHSPFSANLRALWTGGMELPSVWSACEGHTGTSPLYRWEMRHEEGKVSWVQVLATYF